MITNFDQYIKHNKTFYNAFIDLKLQGWYAYSTAFDAYTFNFFKAQTAQLSDAITKNAKTMRAE